MLNKRQFLTGLFGVSMNAALPEQSFSKQNQNFYQDLTQAGFDFYKGSAEDFDKLLMVYAGTPDRLEGVNCDVDLARIGAESQFIERRTSVQVQPVFLFPEGEGENLDIIHSEGFDFAALNASLHDFDAFVHEQGLAFLRYDNGQIKSHTQRVHLMTPHGDILSKVNLANKGKGLNENMIDIFSTAITEQSHSNRLSRFLGLN